MSKMCERDIRKLQNVGNGTYAELQALCEQKGITIGAEYVAP